MRKPKLLFLSFNVEYINPTRKMFKKAIEEACDVYYFGPGYVSSDVLDQGPDRYWDKFGPFDLIAADEYSLFREIPRGMERFYKFSFHACPFDPLLIHKGVDYHEFLMRHKEPRVITLTQFDYYCFSPEMEERLVETGDYYVCWGPEFIQEKQGYSKGGIPAGAIDLRIYDKWSNAYLEFVKRKRNKVLSTPHMIHPTEIFKKPLKSRHKSWSVLGADYHSRVSVRKILDQAGLSRSGRYMPYVFATAERLRVNLYNKFWTIRVLNTLFRKALRASRYSFTCGSILRYPVRKFFEVPAAGCVLVTDGCAGFEALGFKSKENAVLCDPEQILDVHRWLCEDLDRAQAIASAAQQLVTEEHSISARVRQLRESFERILNGTFSGNYWSGGKLCFR